MTGEEASTAAEWLGLRYAIACHYEDADAADVTEFMRILGEKAQRCECGPEPVLLRPGEEIDV